MQNQLSVIVGDTGPGVAGCSVFPVSEDGGMGLSGLRDRVEFWLGGTLELVNRAGNKPNGRRARILRMKLELEKPE